MSDSEQSERAVSPPTQRRYRSETPSSRGSDTEEVKVPVKRNMRMLSDSSDNESDNGSPQRSERGDSDNDKPAKVAHADSKQLFGDDDLSSDSDDDKPSASAPARRAGSTDRESEPESDSSINNLHGIVMANPDALMEEEVKDEAVVHDADIKMPKVKIDFGVGPYFVKMPNFLSVSQYPFDPETYEEDDDDDQVDEEGRNRLKLRMENTLRWRERMDEHGELVRESNAKFVKWSDGTMSMYLGNEIFEVTMMPLNPNNLPHLYTKVGNNMAAQATMKERITFRPHSTDSQTHRKVTLNMADRSRKSGQVKVMDDVGTNPEIQRKELARKEEEALRAHIRKTQIQRNAFKPRAQNRGMMGGYSDDEDGPRRQKGKRKEAPIIGASSDESDGEPARGRKEDSGDDSDEEYRKKKLAQKKRIMSSEDESE